MDAERILFAGECGFHLLFDTATIAEAFAQEEEILQAVADRRGPEIEFALARLLALPSALEARRFITKLPRELQHVLVLVYFGLLEGRLRRRQRLH